jgi:hypothetical protein
MIISDSNKWKWTGDLCVSPVQDKNERLCDILLTDATDHLAEGLRLEILLAEMKTVHFEKFIHAPSVDRVLTNHRPSEQVARIAANKEDDTAILNAFAHCMTVNEEVSILTASFPGMC